MLAEPRESRPAMGEHEAASISEAPSSETGTTVRPATDNVREPRRAALPTLILRDARYIEHAVCVDCDDRWTGKGARRRAGNHAVRRNHRVTWVRTECGELRRRRWPAT